MVSQVTKAGTYKGQDKELKQPAISLFFACRDDLSDDLAYEISKILLEGCTLDSAGRFEKYHPDLDYTLKDIKNLALKSVAPFHPGAIRYLKEIGIWTQEMDKRQKELLAQ